MNVSGDRKDLLGGGIVGSAGERGDVTLGDALVAHPDIARTIRRIFYMLVGTSLFCVVTLGGTFDINLLARDAFVKLPLLNYEMSFRLFLLVGPTVLIGLWIYLHIFMAQYRKPKGEAASGQAMLWDFPDWAPRLSVLATFYWMIPVTLMVFTWKAWPIKPFGMILSIVTLLVTGLSIVLQIRRCPAEHKHWAPKALLFSFPAFGILLFAVVTDRQLSLFGADLRERDLRSLNLANAYLREATLAGENLQNTDLSGANLEEADLSATNLSDARLVGAGMSGAGAAKAILVKADLTAAKLYDAKLDQADLSAATLEGAVLSGAILKGATLRDAKAAGARLVEADLSEAVLCAIDLTEADLFGATLHNANLMRAQLNAAQLLSADLSGANLAGAVIDRLPGRQGVKLAGACGSDATVLPEGYALPECPKERLEADENACSRVQ